MRDDERGPTRASTLPTDPAERKKYPIATGVLDYFPDALVAVAHVSYRGNEQHNPGQPLHWARGKSMDQDDTLLRHMLERGKFDTDGQRHSAKIAWRALAMLQLEIEADQQQVAVPPTNVAVAATERVRVDMSDEDLAAEEREEGVVEPCYALRPDGVYRCTREKGHTGRHVSHPVISSLDVWEDA